MLTVDPVTGQALLRNTSPFAVSIDGYTIHSDSGSLEAGNGDWNSLTDQSTDGWVEADPVDTDLSELNPLSSMTVLPGDEFYLGTPFDTSGSKDLELEFHIFGAPDEMIGVVAYGPVLAGDFNRDGTVDAADYIIWRKMDGSEVSRGTSADGNGDGVVDEYDFAQWQAHFGESPQNGAGGDGDAGIAPEAGSTTFILLAAFGVAAVRRRD